MPALGPDVLILLAAVGFAAVVLALASTVLSGTGRRARKRARTISARLVGEAVDADDRPRQSVRRDTGGPSGLDRIAGRLMPRPALIRERLARTGRSISLGRYLTINLVVGLVLALLAWRYTGLPVLALALGVVGGLMLPHMWVGMAAAGRLKKFISQFPDALDLIVRGLKSGLPITESIGVVADELAQPIAGEFRSVVDEIGVGRTLDDALWMAARRLRLADFDFFVVALSVQRETGGNLAETLENLSDILRRRQQTKLKIKALSSEAKASAYIIGALPFIMFGIIGTVSPDYLDPLLSDPRGNVMLAIGLGWLGLGVAVMAKMVRFEV